MPLENPFAALMGMRRQAEPIDEMSGAPLRQISIDAPQAGNKFEILKRSELVVDHRLVGDPGRDLLGRGRVGKRVDAENTLMHPLSGRSNPATMRNVVVLPAPLGPSRA